MVAYDLIIPTIGRPSLGRLLESVARARGPRPRRIIVVDDRRDAAAPLPLPALAHPVEVVRSHGRGPAAARNRGWRSASAPWIAFLDDDVRVDTAWCADLALDLADPGVTASQGRVVVPLPLDRRPTDWERNVAALTSARWITADFAVRRDALMAVGGFCELFRRAYREDTDLVLRLDALGVRPVRGRRTVMHPVRPADRWVSVRLQAGNADDVLMDALHGRDWRERAGVPTGRFASYPPIVAAGVVAAVAGSFWLAATARFAWERIAPGPRSRDEIVTMLASSAAIPFAAVAHRLRGAVRARRARTAPRVRAVLFDRDGTLIVDTPGLRDPSAVVTMPGAKDALARLRAAGCKLAVVTNQEALSRGTVSQAEFGAVNRRIEELLGEPFAAWEACAHDRSAGCGCRKPAPGLVERAAQRLAVRPQECVVVGDIGADVEAALAAGARAVLVPTAVTRPEEVAAAPVVAADLASAVELILAGAV